MKLWKKIAVFSLMTLALGGCTQSSITTDAPDAVEGVDPAKLNQEEDETLPRDQNILIEDETEPQSMYDWEQVTDEAPTACFLIRRFILWQQASATRPMRMR